MSELSPLERLRTAYQSRQRTRTTDIPVWTDGSLVARIGMVDTNGARDAMRTLMRLMNDDAGELEADDLAGVIAAATRALYVTGEDGTLEPLLGEDGRQLSFDAGFATALGAEHVARPVDAVLLAFSEGEPPVLNTLRLLTVATQVAGWLVGGDDELAEDSLSGR